MPRLAELMGLPTTPTGVGDGLTAGVGNAAARKYRKIGVIVGGRMRKPIMRASNGGVGVGMGVGVGTVVK
jgi:hypothetical protein